MDNGWVKLFTDGSRERGYDHLVRLRLASWSRGRLDNMVGVILHHNGTTMRIDGLGEFWQSDTMESDVLSGETKVVKRSLYKQINERDMGMVVNNGSVLFLLKPTSNSILVSRADVGKWFVLEMNCDSKDISWRTTWANI